MKLVRTIKWSWTVVPAAILVSAVAAGQPGDSGGSFPTPNPCALLSSAEIGAAAGVAVGQERFSCVTNGPRAVPLFAPEGAASRSSFALSPTANGLSNR